MQRVESTMRKLATKWFVALLTSGAFCSSVSAQHNFDNNAMSPPVGMIPKATFDVASGDLFVPVVTITGSTDVYALLLNLSESLAPFPFVLLSALLITPSSTENSAVFDTATLQLTIPFVEIAGTDYRVVLSLISEGDPVQLKLLSAELALP